MLYNTAGYGSRELTVYKLHLRVLVRTHLTVHDTQLLSSIGTVTELLKSSGTI